MINLANARRKDVWSVEESLHYIANGEIGIVIGQFKTKKMTFKGRPKNTEIEFASQKGYKYTFRSWEFAEDRNNPLELAYALTVHKAQGSEFRKVFVVIPNPCFILSREMLYTDLPLKKPKCIISIQVIILKIK